jgi:hypothetical protein
VIFILLFAIIFVLYNFVSLIAVATRVPWSGPETVLMLVTLTIAVLAWRRFRYFAIAMLVVASATANVIAGHAPPSPDPYVTVPPSNTLVIPKKD